MVKGKLKVRERKNPITNYISNFNVTALLQVTTQREKDDSRSKHTRLNLTPIISNQEQVKRLLL